MHIPKTLRHYKLFIISVNKGEMCVVICVHNADTFLEKCPCCDVFFCPDCQQSEDELQEDA
jgi:hypothetical protein